MKAMHHFIVTGGAGFIGSHMVDFLLETYPESTVTCLDKVSYASGFSLRNLAKAQEKDRFFFEKVDLADDIHQIQSIITKNLDVFSAITVFHFAAESCVDQSFSDPVFFTKNNILATQNLLEAIRLIKDENPRNIEKISVLHISTDEVYGEQLEGDSVDEGARLQPSNPYSATKAACDLIVGAYVKSYKLPVAVIRANNIYGPRQFPEKLIAATLDSLQYADRSGLARDKIIGIHGNGTHKRSYLHVRDFVRAVDIVERHVQESGRFGDIFNVGTCDEWTNRDVVEMVCRKYMQMVFSAEIADFSKFYVMGKDRPYNDARYSIDTSKVRKLGWKPEISLSKGVSELIMEMVAKRKLDCEAATT